MSHAHPTSRRRIAAVSSGFALAAAAAIVSVVVPTLAQPIPSPDALRKAALGPNLIDNSGFSKGLSSWATGPAVAVANGGVLQSSKAALLEPSAGDKVVLSDARSTAPKSDAGREYQASAFVRATDRPVQGEFRLTQWRGSSVVAQDAEPFTALVDQWSRVTFTATARGQGDDLVLSLAATGASSGSTLRTASSSLKVDRIRLHPVKGSVTTTSPSPSQSQTPAPDPSTSSPAPAPSTSSPAPQQTQTQAPDPAPAGGGTLFGASVQQGSRSWTDAVAASNQAYGGMEVVRVFYPGLPSKWPGRAGDVGGSVVVSFKAAPADVLAGKYDAYLADWFKNAPRDREIWWSYFHEPEDNVASGDFTAQQWRDAFRRIAGFADAAGNPQLHNTVILMCWTLSPASGRSFNDFFPGKDVVDALGWDCYAHSSSPYSDPADLYSRALATTSGLGLQFGVAETGAKLGVDDASGTKRADWLRSVGRWMLDNKAAFVCYWDAAGTSGADYRLLDEPSRLAWREVVTTYGPHDPI